MGGSSAGSNSKGRALGRALAETRKAARMSQRDVATAMGKAPGTVGRWETGDRMPDEADTRQYLTVVGVTDDRLNDIVAMTKRGDDNIWVAVTLPEQRAQLSALVECENSAERIVAVSPLLIPGLLQTSEYVREMMTVGKVPASEVGTRVAARIGRRDAITRRDPVQLVVLIGEGALRQIVGTPELMIRQLRYLLEMAEYPNIEVRVVPFSGGWHPGCEGFFQLMEPAGDGRPVVHLENRVSGLMLDEPDYITAYRDAFDATLQVAMKPDASAGFVAEVIKDLEQM
jgi:transcriptional regulator with XRE-family HTH domain